MFFGGYYYFHFRLAKMDFIRRRRISSHSDFILRSRISFFVLGSENEDSLKNYLFSKVAEPQRDLAPPVNLALHKQRKTPPMAVGISVLPSENRE